MAVTTVAFTANDTEKDLTFAVTDTSGGPQDITGYTVTLHVQKPDGTAPLVKTAVLTAPLVGEGRFEWVAGDLIAGLHNFEIQLVDPAAEVETLPKGDDIFLLNVRAEIA